MRAIVVPVVPAELSTAIGSGLPVPREPAHPLAMGTKSRETIYGASVRAAAERAAEARKDADRLAVAAWNKRMLGFQGPAQSVPGSQTVERGRHFTGPSQVGKIDRSGFIV
jgi:hypothetical protein